MRKLISVFMLCLFTTTIVKAEETDDTVDDGDYIEVVKGEQVPFDGYLFNHSGIAALIAKHGSEKEQLTLLKDAEIKKVKLDLETELKKKDVELDITKKLNEDIIKINKQELDLAKTKLERVSWVSPSMFVSGIVAGTLITISILKISIGVIK